jgi:coproporphyrinogen III oxidase-like Fe-S oxidoreductase
MGLETATLALIATGASAVGTVAGIVNNNKAKQEQKKVQAEQNASNRAQQLEEQRRQIREERVKRARILQSSENTGVADSSGETGAIGGLSTQLSTNMAFNAGAAQRASNIGQFQQNAADAAGRAQMATSLGQLAPTAFNLGNSIFSTSDSDPLGTFIKQKGF